MEIEEKILKIMSLALYIESESETASVIVRYSSYHGLFQTEICIDCPDETTDKIYNVWWNADDASEKLDIISSRLKEIVEELQ